MSSNNFKLIQEQLDNPRLVVVEDEPGLLDVYTEVLNRFPVEVDGYRDLEDLKEEENLQAIDALITDYSLLNSTGSDVIETVMGEEGNEYVNTALVTSHQPDELDNPDQDIYAGKPIGMDSLSHLGYLVLAGSAHEKALQEHYRRANNFGQGNLGKVPEEERMDVQDMYNEIERTLEDLKGKQDGMSPENPMSYVIDDSRTAAD